MGDVFECVNCPNAELEQLCTEIADMQDVIVIACEMDNEAHPPLAYLELQQTIRINTKANPTTIPIPIKYRYYLNLEQGHPRYEGSLPINIPLQDPEIFIEQFILVNNIGDDVLDEFFWDLRLDTHDVDSLNLPEQLNVKLARQDKSNRDTYLNDFLKAIVELDAAILAFFQEWNPPT